MWDNFAAVSAALYANPRKYRSCGPETNDRSRSGPQATARRHRGIFIPILRARSPNNAFYFPRFRDIVCMRVPCTHTGCDSIYACIPGGSRAFYVRREMQRDFKFAAVSCQNNDMRDNIGRVSINSASAIRPDFTLLNVYERGILTEFVAFV